MMLKTRMKRLARRDEGVVQRLADIEASITQLNNDDLLDFADIFKDAPHASLNEIASAEMAKRNISL